MTKRRMEGLRYLHREIYELEKELRNIQAWGMDTSEIEKLLEKQRERALTERNEIEQILCAVEDPVMRLILRMRLQKGLSWLDVATQMQMSRATVCRKYETFMKEVDEQNEHKGIF